MDTLSKMISCCEKLELKAEKFISLAFALREMKKQTTIKNILIKFFTPIFYHKDIIISLYIFG